MFEIILTTHGKLADGLKDAAQLIIGDADKVHTISLNMGDDVNKLNKKMRELMDEFGQDKEVLFLTDIANASPYNQSLITISQLDEKNQGNKVVLTGANLPMLIQAISEQMSDSNLEEAVESIMSVSVEAVTKWDISSLDEDIDEDDDF